MKPNLISNPSYKQTIHFEYIEENEVFKVMYKTLI